MAEGVVQLFALRLQDIAQRRSAGGVLACHQLQRLCQDVHVLAVEGHLALHVLGALADAQQLCAQHVGPPQVALVGRLLHQLGGAALGFYFVAVDGQRHLQHAHPHVHAVHVGHSHAVVAFLVEHVLHTDAHHRQSHAAGFLALRLVLLALGTERQQVGRLALNLSPLHDGHFRQHDGVGQHQGGCRVAVQQQVELLLLQLQQRLQALNLFLQLQLFGLQAVLVAHAGTLHASGGTLVLVDGQFADVLEQSQVFAGGDQLLAGHQHLVPLLLHVVGQLDAALAVALPHGLGLPCLLVLGCLHGTEPREHLHERYRQYLTSVDLRHRFRVEVQRQFRVA